MNLMDSGSRHITLYFWSVRHNGVPYREGLYLLYNIYNNRILPKIYSFAELKDGRDVVFTHYHLIREEDDEREEMNIPW